MWRPHVSQLVPGLALLAARHRPSWRVLAVAGVVVLPYYVVHAWPVLRPDPYDGSAAEAVELLAALPDGALAISDDPGLVWRAGRRTPPDLVDASVLRIQTGDITSDVARRGRRRARRVRRRRPQRASAGARFDDLPDRLADAGYEVAAEDGEVRRRLPQARLHRGSTAVDARRPITVPTPAARSPVDTVRRGQSGGGRGGRGGGGRGWRR